MRTSAGMDTMPSAIQGNLRDFLANDANRAGLLKLLLEAEKAGGAAAAATIVDASTKSSDTKITTVISGGNGLNTKDNYVQNSNGDIFSGGILWDGR